MTFSGWCTFLFVCGRKSRNSYMKNEWNFHYIIHRRFDVKCECVTQCKWSGKFNRHIKKCGYRFSRPLNFPREIHRIFPFGNIKCECSEYSICNFTLHFPVETNQIGWHSHKVDGEIHENKMWKHELVLNQLKRKIKSYANIVRYFMVSVFRCWTPSKNTKHIYTNLFHMEEILRWRLCWC